MIDRENTIVFYETIRKLLLEVEAIYTSFTELPIGGEGNPSQFTVITIMDAITNPDITGLYFSGGVLLWDSNFRQLTKFLQTYLSKLELINLRFDAMDISDKDIKEAYKKVEMIVHLFENKVIKGT